MTPEQREELIRLLQGGSDISPEWARIVFPPEKREYELVYHGKEREEDILADTLTVPLQAVRTFGANGSIPDWQNMLVFGDNLQGMRTLLDLKRSGKLCNADGTPGVRLVYIDPPFASKQEFRGTQDQKAYQDKLSGAAFLEFLRRRLVLIRDLLSDDGSVVVHLDARKAHYVKVLLDEIFTDGNFRNEIIVKRRITKNLQQQFDAIQSLPVAHDSLFWFSRQPSARFPAISVPTEAKENGYWHHFWSGADRHTMRYELLGVTPKTGQWKWQKSKALEAVANYKRYLKEARGTSLVDYWRKTGKALKFIRLSVKGKVENWYPPAEERIADTLWLDIHAYPNVKTYPTEKDEELLERVIDLGTKQQGDLVLDCFAGSGTTCAVAEKLGRRWIGIDCGKLSIYTIQKRMLNLCANIGNDGPSLKVKPFTLFNAGLYDFSTLRELPWDSWRFFALQLFQCRDEPHKINGVQFDGYLKGSSVLVFKHRNGGSQRLAIDEGTIESIHSAVGRRVSRRVFIIAPAMSFDFQQDYLELDGLRYYALRIPYSIIHELHKREFTALRQPADEMAVNDTVEAVGFDFIRPPTIEFKAERAGAEGVIRITKFGTQAAVKVKASDPFDTFSMLLIDYDFDTRSQIFDLDAVVYADALRARKWEHRFPVDGVGRAVMVVCMDIYGNEARVLFDGATFRAKREASNRLSRVTARARPRKPVRQRRRAPALTQRAGRK